MTRKYRLSLIALSLAVLIIVGRSITGDFSFVLGQFWFTSGLLLLVLLSLIDQPHFSKDSNIFVNAVTAGISLLLVEGDDRDFIYWFFFIVTIYLLASSYTLLWIRQHPLAEENKLTRFFSRLNREIGKPEALFSVFFIWGAHKQFGTSSNEFDALLVYWVVFIILNIPSLARAIEDLLTSETQHKSRSAIGQIFGVQSKNTFLIKLMPIKKREQKCRLFDFVEFRHGADEIYRRGLIIDNYILNQEQWVKVLSSPQIDQIFYEIPAVTSGSTDIVYKVTEVPENNILGRLVGIVTDNSRINYLRFIYNSAIQVSEGQLLGVRIGKVEVLYQIVEGITNVETLEQKNQSGLIIGEAIQLGTWNRDKLQFEQFGWVPDVNTPVFLATNIEVPEISHDEMIVGQIPNTNYPVVLNKSTAMSHHMAVIGVTGTGKSVFSRNLVREFLKNDDTKVICIDFTGEYSGKFKDLVPRKAIDTTVADQLFKDIDFIEREISGNYNKDTNKSREKKKEV